MLDIKIERTKNPKEKPDKDQEIEFGSIFTDHMFIMDYEEGKGWINPRIEEYKDFMISPAAMVFHYGQTMFEGMKAYKTPDGRVVLFRPQKNIERANNSNRRLCIPEIPAEDFLQAVIEVVKIDKDWIPEKKGSSLYIRPFIISTEPSLNVKPSSKYTFMIILSPVGAYYKEGLNPVKIWVEDEYVRAVRGGIGEAKTGGNYAASLFSQEKASFIKLQGYVPLENPFGLEENVCLTMQLMQETDGWKTNPNLTFHVPRLLELKEMEKEECQPKNYT